MKTTREIRQGERIDDNVRWKQEKELDLPAHKLVKPITELGSPTVDFFVGQHQISK